MKGLFITFEGGDGAGKSTLSKGVCDALSSTHDVLMTREPGGTPLGDKVRELLLHSESKIAPRAELFLFLAARIQHVEQVIQPALEAGKIVLCDRFSDSTIAYQGGGRDMGVNYIENCTALAIDSFKPNLTFYLDIDPEVGLKRASKRGAHDRFEKEAIQFHTKLRETFLLLAQKEPQRIIVLDATSAPHVLLQEALEQVYARLK